MFAPRRSAAILLGLSSLLACGKKGPPLAPIVRIPAAITMIAAQRVGNDFYVTLTVPTTNIDGTMPLDIGRIEIYGYTGTTAPPTGRFLEVATRVASVPVVPLPTTPASAAAAPVSGTPPSPAGTPPPAPVGAPAGATPGSRVTIVDSLTPDQLQQGRVIAPVTRSTAAAAVPPPAEAGRVQPLRRFYLALPFSTTGRIGPEPAATAVALVEPPPPPEALTATATPQSVVLTWEPNAGIVGFLFGQLLPPEPNPAEDVFDEPPEQSTTPALDGPVRYNVYAQDTPVAGAPATPAIVDVPWQRSRGTPINPAPLAVMTLPDPIVFGRERCYTVRALRGTPPNALESAPTAPVCITPVDTYPPATPVELVAVAAEGSISLIWEPGSDPDLAGYLVLRGAPGDATLRPLTPSPVTEARYIDTMVTAGTRYVYAVIAVDNAMPTPNMSAESMRVEETAR